MEKSTRVNPIGLHVADGFAASLLTVPSIIAMFFSFKKSACAINVHPF